MRDDDIRVAEKGRISRFAAPVIHLAILVIMAGAMIGNLVGIKGTMLIPEGSAVSEMRLDRPQNGMDDYKLDFDVKCNKFSIDYYPDSDRPKTYKSDLSIIENGHEAMRKTIEVNKPMAYKGFRFFQSTYGKIPGIANITVRDRQGGKSWDLEVPPETEMTVPGTNDKFMVMEAVDNQANAGPAVRLTIVDEGKSPVSAWLFLKSPDFDLMRGGRYQLIYKGETDKDYTGLSVSTDQGAGAIWAGCLIMFAGLGMAFLLSHRRVAIAIRPDGIEIFGSANKKREALESLLHNVKETWNGSA